MTKMDEKVEAEIREIQRQIDGEDRAIVDGEKGLKDRRERLATLKRIREKLKG